MSSRWPRPICRVSRESLLDKGPNKTHRDERVDRLETSLHGLVDRTTGQDTGSLELSLSTTNRVDRTLAVNGVTQSVDDTAEQTGTDGNVDNLTGTLDGVTLLDETIVTENGDTDIVGLEIQAHALDTGRELYHLLGLDVAETVDTSDTVTDGWVGKIDYFEMLGQGNRVIELGKIALTQDTTSLLDIATDAGARDALLEDRRDLGSG